MNAFFVPNSYESVKKNRKLDDVFFAKYTWEQAARICEYVLKYFE